MPLKQHGQQSCLRTYWVLGPKQQETAAPGLTRARPWGKSLLSKPQFPEKTEDGCED